MQEGSQKKTRGELGDVLMLLVIAVVALVIVLVVALLLCLIFGVAVDVINNGYAVIDAVAIFMAGAMIAMALALGKRR